MLRLTREMFVAEIVGHSMEPLIPDRLCVFTGRDGIAAEAVGLRWRHWAKPAATAIPVKRYHSEKRQSGNLSGRTERIRLEPLNPAFEAWDLDPREDRYRILAEFVQVVYQKDDNGIVMLRFAALLLIPLAGWSAEKIRWPAPAQSRIWRTWCTPTTWFRPRQSTRKTKGPVHRGRRQFHRAHSVSGTYFS